MPVRMTDEQLRAWIREAEEGYDVDALKHEHAQQRRKPLRGAVSTPERPPGPKGHTPRQTHRNEPRTSPGFERHQR